MRHSAHLKVAEAFTELLENKFKVGPFRFGLDAALGIFPGIGDAIGMFLSFYLLWIGVKMRLPEEKLIKMAKNIIYDFLLGLIPVVGDVADFIHKANLKNLKILKAHVADTIIEGEIVR